jgi:hypothetical protein
MKQLLFYLFLFLGGTFPPAYANNPVNVSLSIIRTSDVSNGNIKSEPLPLLITLEDYTITLPATDVDYTLELRDENGTLVYTAFIPQGSTQIVLPTTFSGEFEIRLVANTYYYIGVLEL